MLNIIIGLPMNENSTQVKNEINDETVVQSGPKESTVNFLKQFARIYSYNENVSNGLGEFFAN